MAQQAADIERGLLKYLGGSAGDEGIADSTAYAASIGVDHKDLVSALRSLSAEGTEMVVMQESSRSKWVLTKEAESYLEGGSPEAQVFRAVASSEEGKLTMSQLRAAVGEGVAGVGFKQAMQMRWVKVLKQPKPKDAAPPPADAQGGKKKKEKEDPVVVPQAEDIEDKTQSLLASIKAGAAIDGKDSAALKKRKLISLESWKVYGVTRGEKFALERKRLVTDLTKDMLVNDAWRDHAFKKYNFQAMGSMPTGGHLHPLLKVRTQFRKIFVRMGFQEMPTNQFVENSFWNFDALFQPQQHPARDAHDTFFLTKPRATPAENLPADYVQRVRDVHEKGGHGSLGYGYNWKLAEAEKNILRTHTTAVSSRMLYKLAKAYEREGVFTPKKYFSIDRVFRNESVDRTHLAEFHQCEGLVADRNLSLAHLIGTIEQFFKNIGMTNIKFKPAYNPYTEPSMEIFAFHPGLGKWTEIGNSGIFRPEMLRPMGLPEDVSVIAWGLSLERPTMVLYGVDNIRDLFGHKVDLGMIKSNPVCRIGL